MVYSVPRLNALTERLAALGAVVRTDVDLSAITRWRIGGRASLIVEPMTLDQLRSAVLVLRGEGHPFVVFGATTNLLFADDGLDVPALRIGPALSAVTVSVDSIVAQSGAFVPSVARRAAQVGFAGVEHICGIPGTIGGLVFMNGGSMRKSVGSHIDEVLTISTDGEWVKRRNADCDFRYRHSGFQDNGEIVACVRFVFPERADPAALRRMMLDIMATRRKKFPQKEPNCGSVFKVHDNMYPQYGPPGAVLDRLGFKGRRVGAAQVSFEHSNFINNTGGAIAEEVRFLADMMREAVLRDTGYMIEPEARFVHPDGRITPLI